MFLGQEYPIFDWFIIHFTENNGMAFGMEFGGLTGKTLLTLFRIIVVVVGIYYVKSIVKPHLPSGALIALGLVIGGAIGNIIDSSFYGLLFNDRNEFIVGSQSLISSKSLSDLGVNTNNIAVQFSSHNNEKLPNDIFIKLNNIKNY